MDPGTPQRFRYAGCERRQEQQFDPGEFVTVGEAALGDLVMLAMTGGMTDPGGVLLTLPFLMDDPGVRSLLAFRPR